MGSKWERAKNQKAFKISILNAFWFLTVTQIEKK
jgi:hypothetical protein